MVVMRLARIVEGQLEGPAQARWRNHEVGSSPASGNRYSRFLGGEVSW